MGVAVKHPLIKLGESFSAWKLDKYILRQGNWTLTDTGLVVGRNSIVFA